MNVLDRITDLRLERNWSEYQLAEQSGLTQSTISSWYKKNMLPTIPSLEKLCIAYHITLSQFFLEEDTVSGNTTITLTQEQLKLLHNAAKLKPEQSEALVCFLEKL